MARLFVLAPLQLGIAEVLSRVHKIERWRC